MLLAQLNVARLLAPIDSPRLAEFVAQLDEINALAEASPGFVWRFTGDARDGGASVPGDPRMIFSLSVWRDPESLHQFVYRSLHARPMAGRRAWFERPAGPNLVLWWVPEGHRPDLAEALERLARLARDGAGAEAFDFKHCYDAAGREISVRPGALA